MAFMVNNVIVYAIVLIIHHVIHNRVSVYVIKVGQIQIVRVGVPKVIMVMDVRKNVQK